MNIRPGKSRQQVWLSGLALGTVLLLTLLSRAAEINPFGLGTNVRFPDYYDYPNQTKLRTLVLGSSVIPLGTNRYRVKNVHIESFRLTGEPEAIVDAPDCIYDHRTRTANSEGLIKGRTADGQLRFEGIGFLLSLTNKSLDISNNFSTVIRDATLAPKKP